LVRRGHLPEREIMTGIECVVGECATLLVEAASASGGERARGSAGYPDEDQSRRIEGAAATRPGPDTTLCVPKTSSA
jgi:hypothetical protein